MPPPRIDSRKATDVCAPFAGHAVIDRHCRDHDDAVRLLPVPGDGLYSSTDADMRKKQAAKQMEAGASPEWRRILWPTDLSLLSMVALPHALGLVATQGATLLLLHVLPARVRDAAPDLCGSLSTPGGVPHWAAAQDQLRRMAAGLKRQGVRIHALLLEGERTASADPSRCRQVGLRSDRPGDPRPAQGRAPPRREHCRGIPAPCTVSCLDGAIHLPTLPEGVSARCVIALGKGVRWVSHARLSGVALGESLANGPHLMLI